jgi:hypothetical protein
MSTDGTNPSPAAMDVTPGQEITFYVVADSVGGPYWTYLTFDTDALVTIPGAIETLPAADPGASIPPMPPERPYDIELTTGSNPTDGAHFRWILEINSDAPYLDQFSMWITVPNDDNYSVEDIVDFTVVPEPMTIALLGLGGLFLRRRR